MTAVFLITLDAFRADLISEEVTPFLWKASSQGINFTNAVATGSGTSSAFPGILAGTLPLQHGYAKLREEHTTIAEQLPSSVSTIGVSSSTPTSSVYNFDTGFDDFTGIEGESRVSEVREKVRNSDFIRNNQTVLHIGEKITQLLRKATASSEEDEIPYLRAETVTKSLFEKIDGQTEDLFVWAHYMDTHTPYYPPDQHFRGKPDSYSRTEINTIISEYHPKILEEDAECSLSDAVLNALWDYYEAEASYIDSNIKELASHIREQYDEFTLIICADHGEEFGEHGHFGHPPKLYEELVHVPLIIYSDRHEPKTVSKPVSVARVPATVADLFDVEPSAEWKTPSLLTEDGSQNDRPVFSELSHTPKEGLGGTVQPEKAILSVRKGRWKYILNKQTDSEELYDLSVDDRERNNVIDEHREIANELRQLCNERLDEISSNDSQIDVSTDVSDRLEKLGYIEK
ncbi:sulfatase-like hydrolase/transferase [Halopiger xanaduensis]|uniref:Sulfatase n=1 Tax=Halopiger xanaduensis (strain DSM 18323 / JCM 14033 / SH-6) TaxID=797210 RepID=F8DD51_HALXS|nr:sulfatase-like hydrolase/transferase [Halopiger xanaduensis]AEH38938.1 sulfatase [Halopiger xanaduensis SH-6]